MIRERSLKSGIDPLFVAAIIAQESNGEQYAIRYEPNFYVKYVRTVSRENLQGYVPQHCSLNTEKHARAMSWGLMQIMGQTAREAGFRGEFLSELLIPQVNLDVGIGFLRRLLDRTNTKDEALLRYNGGGNPNYPKEVEDKIKSGRANEILGM